MTAHKHAELLRAIAVLPEESWPTMLPKVSRFAYAMADAMLKARTP